MRFFGKKRGKSLKALLFDLRKFALQPPTSVDFFEWQENIDEVMENIRSLSLATYEQLEGLVLELEKRGMEHVRDIDNEVSPTTIEESGRRYFEQRGFLTSEIQSLRPLE